MNDDAEHYMEWSVVELMGHQRLGGLVTSSDFPFADLMIEIPGVGTRYYTKSAVYGVHPVDEVTARRVAADGDFNRMAEKQLVALGDFDTLTTAVFEEGKIEQTANGSWRAFLPDGSSPDQANGDLSGALRAIGIDDIPF